MAILEKEILVLLNSKNIKHFECLGYKIPKHRLNKKLSKSRLRVPKGTKILVNVNDLPKGGNQRVTKICDECGENTPNQRYVDILYQRKNTDGKDRCKKCGRIWEANNRKGNIPYEKSLEFYAIKNKKEHLLEEFSYKNIKRPIEISHGTEDRYLWNCSICKNEFNMRINDRKKNKNCPYCSGHRVLNGFNDLWTTHPEIAKLLKNTERGYEVSFGSNKIERFICNECNFEISKKVDNIVRFGLPCLCTDGIKYPEKFMMSILNQLGIEYKRSMKFDWSQSKIYDFYIEDLNLIIETHGMQHYNGSFGALGGRDFNEEHGNDIFKEKIAKENGIENYVVIDCRRSDLEFIRNSIVSSNLSKEFDLSKIEWKRCHKFSLSSLVKIVCSLWKDVNNALEIGKIVNLDRITIIRYLKQGKELGWCDYNPKEEIKKSGIISGKNGKKLKKPIVQLTKHGEYIRDWDSINEASIALDLHHTPIAKVCKGKPNYNTAGGFKWMFKEDYENIINNQSKVV